ncbi:MAG: C39 family peptidase [Candidatus Nanohaloarchaea archaeon]
MAIASSLLAPASGEDALLRVLFTLVILVFGHIGVKLFQRLSRWTWITRQQELSKKEVEDRHETLQYISYFLDGAIVVFGLLYLNTGITSQMTANFVEFLPRLLSAILVGILGVIAINLSVKFGSEFLEVLGVHAYFREVGLSRNALKLLSGMIRAFLYLLLLQIALEQVGIGGTFIDQFVNASSWAVAFLAAGLLFYGFKDLFTNFAAGVYLKNSRLVRPGEEVKMDEETAEIKEISLFSTTLDTDTGYTLVTPNSEVMDSDIRFKRTKSDIDTLEDMKSYFVAQHPAYCGPASMEMALDIFGYRHDQDEIGEKSDTTEETGTDREKLMEAVEELTDNEVRTAYVEYEKITDLSDEFKAWFNEGALIVPNFYKPELFPEANTGHYVLSAGVEGDEVLVVDPSGHTGSGGVYYVDDQRLYDAMGDHGHKRGYIVVAPEGTTAHWRIENDLIYSDKNYYDELSKTLETRLRKLLRQGSLLKNVMPSSIQDYLQDWQGRDRVTRVWNSGSPEEGEE